MDLKAALIVANALNLDADGTKTSAEMQAGSDTDEKWLAMANKARKGKDRALGGGKFSNSPGKGWSPEGTFCIPPVGK